MLLALRRTRPAALLLLLALSVACRTERVVGDPPPEDATGLAPRLGQPLSGDLEADRAHLRRLEARAGALAGATGCALAATACTAAPVGAKACGGPRYHLPFCPLGTDLPALNATLADIERFERALNERYGLGSDCAYESPPLVGLVGGACRVTGP